MSAWPSPERILIRPCLIVAAPLLTGTAPLLAQTTEIPLVTVAPPPLPVPLPPVIAPPPPSAQLPDPIRNLINAAITSGDQIAVQAIMRYARQTNPGASAQIDALAAEFQAKQAEKIAREARERADKLASAAFLDNWKGELEIGGSYSTGNTNNLALYGSATLNKEGLHWRHLVTGRVDFQTTDKVTTAEHVNAMYQPSYKFSPQLYVFGITQYERDRFLGYLNRFTLGTGLGYTITVSPTLTINLQGGPAVRRTDRIDEASRTTAAGRGSVGVKWAVTPTLSLTEDAAAYLEAGDSNASSTTSLDTKLIGALKARLSYNIQYERNAPDGRKSVDTTSRATLVYGF